MKTQKYSSRLIAVLLVLALLFAAAPIANAYTLQTGKITTHYIGLNDHTDTAGQQLTASTERSGSSLAAPDIEHHRFVRYTQEITHVYSQQHRPYIIGFPDGSVGPERDMTRAEAAMVFHRMFWWERDSSDFTRSSLFTTNTFRDVSLEDWFGEAVETLYNAGITNGTPGDQFRPHDPITRQELAVMAARFDGMRSTSARQVFSDVERGHWATPYIHAAAEVGWVIGYPDGTFRPGEPIIRAEVVTLINRVLDRTLAAEDVPVGVNPYNDLVSSFWAFGDLIEASILHDVVGWHGTVFNNGQINIITERFVDVDGNELREPIVRAGELEHHPRAFDGYVYYGYVKEITFIYAYHEGAVAPFARKSPSVTEAAVGDVVTYTITVGNAVTATYPWRGVVLTDELDPGLTFQFGSVQIDGRSVPFSFVDRTLTVALGDIDPGDSVTVTFAAVVNSTAFGRTIRNVAILEGDNGGSVEAPGEDIVVDEGVTWAEVRKTADRSTASVGDTITYTVRATNIGLATGDWRNVVMTDVIPQYLEFVEGSVSVNGSTLGVDSNFAANTRALTVRLGNLAPGETATVTFRARVLDGAQGRVINNVAYLTGTGTDRLPAPDGGVEIDAGEPRPTAAKSSSHNTIQVGERVTYTITLSNGVGATAPWRNIVVNDVLPAGFSFVSGSVMVDGISHPHGVAGQALTIWLGDIAPGQTVTITFQATALESGMGQTWYNVATISSDNAPQRQVTDSGTTIPREEMGTPQGPISVSATKTTGRPHAYPGETVTYTITATNPADNDHTWHNVTLTDLIDTGAVTFISGSVTINGTPANAAQHSYVNRLLTVRLGDISPGQTVVVQFNIVVKSDAHDTVIHNTATLVGASMSGGTQDTMVRVSAQLPVPYDSRQPISGIHMQLFRGFPGGTWRPESSMTRAEAATVFHRILVRPAPGTAPTPQDVYHQSGGFYAVEAIRFFLTTGGMNLDANGNFRPTAPITMREFNQLSMSVIGRALLPDSNDPLTRILAAGALADAQGRSRNPITNGQPYNTFTDVPRNHPHFGLVIGISTDHGFFYDLHGNQWWEAF
ncbi:MAG: isopeptide-forming domain-containing fimbrial protein [Oscillospiraceae bacterium]|nr:isopeptide-forming domain-containing fimbrial protein [Oscillospiraceae bacterium]